MKYYTEFYKLYGRLPNKSVTNFAEPEDNKPYSILLRERPEKVLEILRKKKHMIPSKYWDDLTSEIHDKVFTVAGIMKADILQEIFNYVEKAIEEGVTIKQFIQEAVEGGLVSRMQQAGWTGKSPSRLKVIYDTNARMAYGKAEYQSFKNVANVRPYLIYHQLHRKTQRHEHEKWDNKKFHIDDPIWQSILPPSGYGCGCWVESTGDSTGVEEGTKYNTAVTVSNNSQQLNPLKAWKPDTDKYTADLRKQVNTMLKSVKK